MYIYIYTYDCLNIYTHIYTHLKWATCKPKSVITMFPMTHCSSPFGIIHSAIPSGPFPWINMISQLFWQWHISIYIEYLLYYIILYYIILYYIIVYYIILYFVLYYNIILYYIILYFVIYYIILYYIVYMYMLKPLINMGDHEFPWSPIEIPICGWWKKHVLCKAAAGKAEEEDKA